jgi:hypothetical protein
MDIEKISNWAAGGGATVLGGVIAWAAKWYHGKLYESMEQRVREAVMQATIDLKNDMSDFGGRVSSLEAHQEDMRADLAEIKTTWEKVHMDIQNLPQRVVEAMRK